MNTVPARVRNHLRNPDGSPASRTTAARRLRLTINSATAPAAPPRAREITPDFGPAAWLKTSQAAVSARK